MKQKTGLYNAIEILEEYLKFDGIKDELSRSAKRNLLSILKKYQGNTIRALELNVPYTMQRFLSIADSLKKNGITSPEIDYWQELKKSQRYNIG